MNYADVRKKQGDELNAFPMFFAFSMGQFEQGLKKLSSTKEDVIALPGGGWIKRTDESDLLALFERHSREMEEAMKEDQFLIGSIYYELGNHEYGYTGDPQPTLEALDISLDDERVLKCFATARKQFLQAEREAEESE